MKIVITSRSFYKNGQKEIKQLELEGFEVFVNSLGRPYNKKELFEATRFADCLIVGTDKCDKELINNCPNLKAIIKQGVGIDNIDVDYAFSKGIIVKRTIGSNSRSVAETTIAFIFADSKNLIDNISTVRNGSWTKRTGYDLYGKKIGVIGLGAIGQKVAIIAKGIGMDVLCYTKHKRDKKIYDELSIKESTLEEIYKKSDVITVHIPLNEKTENLITMNEMRMMKPNCLLINTSRGGIINEDDLHKALKERIIRSAYFDVMTNEPPINSKLLSLDNFFLTPHCASSSKEADKLTINMATSIAIEEMKKISDSSESKNVY